MVVVLVKGLILVPYYLRSFGLEGYGAWLGSGNVLAFVAMLEGGFTLVYSQKIAAECGRGDWRAFAGLAGAGGALLGAAALAVGLLTVAISPWVPDWVHVSGELAGDLRLGFALGGVGFGASLAQGIFFSVFNAWQRPGTAGAIRLGTQVLEVALIVLGLRLGLGLVAMGAAGACAGVAGLAVAAWATRRTWRRLGIPPPEVSRAQVRLFSRTAIPVFLSRSSAVVLNNNEPLVASTLLGPEQAGLLALTDRVFKNIQIIAVQLGQALFYGLAHLHGAVPDPGRIRAVTREAVGYASAFLAVAFAVPLVMNPEFVTIWVGGGHFGGIALNVVIGLATLMANRANLLTMMAAALGGNVEASLCQLAELLLRLPLMFWLAPRYGIMGLPLATLVSTTILGTSLGALVLARRLGQHPAAALGWSAAGLLTAGLPVACAVLALLLLPPNPHPTWPAFVGKCFLAAVAASAVALLVQRRAGAAVLGFVRARTGWRGPHREGP